MLCSQPTAAVCTIIVKLWAGPFTSQPLLIGFNLKTDVDDL
jgi:hypothetical protein